MKKALAAKLCPLHLNGFVPEYGWFLQLVEGVRCVELRSRCLCRAVLYSDGLGVQVNRALAENKSKSFSDIKLNHSEAVQFSPLFGPITNIAKVNIIL